MDLWWGFNNVRIKEGDKWKGAFMTHVGFFKPTVMFFAETIGTENSRLNKLSQMATY